MQKVATLDSTVLITGESGTGKEMLARRVHAESDRRDGPFIAVNLAAVPSELVESTLFGHEKGAFTGAVRQQLGKFELANGGTLFLDEIGDLRLDLQAKLLRAIQENEIERVGGTNPIRVDFRLVVATNVDLGGRAGGTLPRGPVLPDQRHPGTAAGPARAAWRTSANCSTCSSALRLASARSCGASSRRRFAVLRSYVWPGNIRELQNLVERVVATDERGFIAEEDLPLELQLVRLKAKSPSSEGRFADAVGAFERNLIVRALQECDGNVSAASRYLGVPHTTLKARSSGTASASWP